jgi:photoactive yellow protein
MASFDSTQVLSREQATAALYAEIERLRDEVETLRRELAAARSALSAQGRRITRDFSSQMLQVATPSNEPSTVHSQITARPAPPAPPLPAAPSLMPGEAPPAPFAAMPHGGQPALATQDQGLDFGAVARLSPEQLDALPYGLITLDAAGRVLHYNDTESRMVGLPKERVIGKRFFAEVAPCARVREFEGRFEELVRDPHRVRVQSFDFVFRFSNGHQQVTIVMTPARVRGQYNIALLRRGSGE